MKKSFVYTMLVIAFLMTACGGAVTEVSPTVEMTNVSPVETIANTETMEPTAVKADPTEVVIVSTNTIPPKPTMPIAEVIPVDEYPTRGLPYFEGSDLVDVFAMGKAKCISTLYSENSSKVNEVMVEKGLTQVEAVDDICSPPVVVCEQIPSQFARIPILGLGEAWEEGLKSSLYAGAYQNVPSDEFIPGTDYCWFDMGVSLRMEKQGESLGERPSLCPYSERTGVPSQDAKCWYATLTIRPEQPTTSFVGGYQGDYYLLDKVSEDVREEFFDFFISGTVGQYPDWTLPVVWDKYRDDTYVWFLTFEIPADPFLLSFGWEPYESIIIQH